MFTGIVEGTGTVRRAERRADVMTVRIDVGGLFEGLPLGGSVAVNGCCLTAVRSDAQGFDVDLTEETLRRTRFDERLSPGALVNLERPMKADGRFDGHVVQGPVGGIGRVREMRWLGESGESRIEPPRELERYLVGKGGIQLLIAPSSTPYLQGVTLDFIEMSPGDLRFIFIPPYSAEGEPAESDAAPAE